MTSILTKLGAIPWVARQLTKLTGYISAPLAVIVGKAEVPIEAGGTIDVFNQNQETAIVLGAIALVSGVIEAIASYATHKAK